MTAADDVGIQAGQPDLLSWLSLGACATAPSDLFTVGADEVEPDYPSQEAVSYCHRCTVRTICLDYALEHYETGVWGATSSYQRQALRARRSRASCPGCGSQDIVRDSRYEVCLACGVSWAIPNVNS